MMTKKDFELIAGIISEFEPPFCSKNQSYVDDLDQTEDTRGALAEIFANALKFENPNFDKNRFMAACGINE